MNHGLHVCSSGVMIHFTSVPDLAVFRLVGRKIGFHKVGANNVLKYIYFSGSGHFTASLSIIITVQSKSTKRRRSRTANTQNESKRVLQGHPVVKVRGLGGGAQPPAPI